MRLRIAVNRLVACVHAAAVGAFESVLPVLCVPDRRSAVSVRCVQSKKGTLPNRNRSSPPSHSLPPDPAQQGRRLEFEPSDSRRHHCAPARRPTDLPSLDDTSNALSRCCTVHRIRYPTPPAMLAPLLWLLLSLLCSIRPTHALAPVGNVPLGCILPLTGADSPQGLRAQVRVG